MNARPPLRWLAVLPLVLAAVAFPPSSSASHSWANYHWARADNPFAIAVIDSMTTSWDDNLSVAIADWDRSSVLDVVKEAGDASARTRKRCRPASGKVRACNAEYGRNGWLGLAQIWVSGDHITQGTAKMNDSYLASSSYTPTNRQHVICQEIGHSWGLGHQDESGADLNTCMDYSRALDNPHPNAHDYEQLETIYNSHLDRGTTITPMPAAIAGADLSAPAQWGKLLEGAPGRGMSVYVRDFGGGHRVVTFVTWAN